MFFHFLPFSSIYFHFLFSFFFFVGCSKSVFFWVSISLRFLLTVLMQKSIYRFGPSFPFFSSCFFLCFLSFFVLFNIFFVFLHFSSFLFIFHFSVFFSFCFLHQKFQSGSMLVASSPKRCFIMLWGMWVGWDIMIYLKLACAEHLQDPKP